RSCTTTAPGSVRPCSASTDTPGIPQSRTGPSAAKSLAVSSRTRTHGRSSSLMREPRLFGLMVTRNEADRYLQACLEWHAPLFDGLLVYDDHSDDATFHVVRHVGATYVRRPVGVPSFMEHEGHFRQDSLDQLVARFGLAAGDWVAVIDTDEFLVGPDDLRGALRGAIRR